MDVLDDSSSNVWGVVYQIDETDVGRLDRREGYRPGRPMPQNSYCRAEQMVYEDGDEHKPLTAAMYTVVNRLPTIPPSQEYKDLIAGGARHWHLPNDYIELLEKIVVAGQNLGP